MEDYNEYCHYVAGLVGYGLSRLFHAAGTEDLASDQLSNSMGLFLQVFSLVLFYLYFHYHNELKHLLHSPCN